ncbi:MAG: enoyl-CoA hydratase [Mesorhizobium amorphae]|nr:MAG: enoyl-CoA hydratase [Mesorhizobium amorphae]
MSDPHPKRWAFEDFEIGLSIDLGERTVTADEIVEFAREFDPQPMHLEVEAGRDSLLGGLAASGWHTCAIFMRMMCDGFLNDSTSQGAPGLDFVRWKRPVLAGDTLSGRSTVLDRRLSKSRLGLGLVSVGHEVRNGRGEVVMELQNTAMFATREAFEGRA